MISRTTRTPTIDVHAHIVPTAVLEAARAGGDWHGVPLRVEDDRIVWDTEGQRHAFPTDVAQTSVRQRLLDMDRWGVDVQLLSHMPRMLWYSAPAEEAGAMVREINDSIANSVADAPQRLRGLAHLPLQNVAAAVDELRYAVQTLGFVGAAIGTSVNGVNWDDPELWPVLEAADELDVMLFVHPCDARFPTLEHPYHLQNLVGFPFETTFAFSSMLFGGVFDRLPGLRVCYAHGGGYACVAVGRMTHAQRARDDVRGRIFSEATEYPNHVWFDSLTHSPEFLRFILDAAGADHVVLGTDYPADMAQAFPVDWVNGVSGLTDEVRSLVLGGNMRELLGEKIFESIIQQGVSS